MSETKNIIIATANVQFAKSLKKIFESRGVKVLEIASYLDMVFESIEKAMNDGKQVDGLIISSDIAKKLDDLRLELLADSLYTIRERYSDTSVVLLSNQQEGHPFLRDVVTVGIYKIFIKGGKNQQSSFNINDLIDVLHTSKKFSEVSHLLQVDPSIRWRKDVAHQMPQKIEVDVTTDDEEDGEVEEADETKDKTTEVDRRQDNENEKNDRSEKQSQKKPKKKKEKTKREKKIIQKQVIKREYKIELNQSTEKIVGVTLEPKLIVVCGVTRRVGTTFFAHLLSSYISELDIDVTYFENPFEDAYSYDRYFGEQHAPDYISPYAEARGEQLQEEKRTHSWDTNHIHWVVKHPMRERMYIEEEIPFEFFIKVILSQKTPIRIIDIGMDWEKEIFSDLMEIADQVFVVTDHDLMTVQQMEEDDALRDMIVQCKEKNSLHVVMNRSHPKQSNHKVFAPIRKEIGEFHCIPQLDSHVVFESQYKGELLMNTKDVKKELDPYFTSIIEDIIPAEIVKKKRRRFKWQIPKVVIQRD